MWTVSYRIVPCKLHYWPLCHSRESPYPHRRWSNSNRHPPFLRPSNESCPVQHSWAHYKTFRGRGAKHGGRTWGVLDKRGKCGGVWAAGRRNGREDWLGQGEGQCHWGDQALLKKYERRQSCLRNNIGRILNTKSYHWTCRSRRISHQAYASQMAPRLSRGVVGTRAP